jgi:hypothetical protein
MSVSGTRVARRVQAGVGVCALEKRKCNGPCGWAQNNGSADSNRRVATAVQEVKYGIGGM